MIEHFLITHLYYSEHLIDFHTIYNLCQEHFFLEVGLESCVCGGQVDGILGVARWFLELLSANSPMYGILKGMCLGASQGSTYI